MSLRNPEYFEYGFTDDVLEMYQVDYEKRSFFESNNGMRDKQFEIGQEI